MIIFAISSLTIDAKTAIISFCMTGSIFFILGLSLIRSVMIASCLAANLRILRTFPGLSSLSPSLYPHWAISRVTVNKNNFLDGLDVISILLNFLLISQTYSFCDGDLFRYIPLVVTPCNTEKFGALRIHMFLNHPIFSVCFFPSSKSSFSTCAICIAIR